MKDPANATRPTHLTTVRVNANVQWRWRVGSGGNYVAICDSMKVSVQARTWSELIEEINIATNALVMDLVETNEFEDFMREHGWTLAGRVSGRPEDVRYEVPFELLQFSGAMNGLEHGSQRNLPQ